MRTRRLEHRGVDMDDVRLTRKQLAEQLHDVRAELDQAQSRLRSDRDMQAIVHDLEVHQEEVRMQNEQLRETQHALEESCERYTDLYDFAPLAYITLDGNGVIQDINLTAASLLGVERSRLVNMPLLLFVLEMDRHILLSHLMHCRRAGAEAQLTAELRLKINRTGTQHVIPVHLVTRPGPKHSPPTFRTAITDLSEQYKAAAERRELQLREQAAQAASEAKDRFLAMLSHELRTPLTPVLAAATAIELNGVLPNDVRNLIEIIRRNVEIEAKLIDDLLDVTRISRGKLHLTTSIVDLNSVVHDVKLLFAEECAAKDIHCDSELKAERHHVRGDPIRLRQVIWNLMKNAIKFTPRGGKVTIRAVNDASNRLILSITDTGIGIEPEDRARIFDPFEQAATGQRPLTSGLGLGLFICKALIDSHNGQISVSSPGRNQGATFVISLETIDPLTAPSTDSPAQSVAEANRPPSAANPESKRAGLGILLVEDHPDTATVMTQLLRRHGHKVKVANSVKDALTMANQDVDLVISDLGLPDGSGVDLIREIHKARPVPGIALSGYGTDDDIRRSREAGFSEHLVKPVNFPHLLAVIDRLAPPASDAAQFCA